MGGQYPSWSDVKGLSLERANEYCIERGKYMVEGKWETHGSRGWTPLNAELTFQCLDDATEEKNEYGKQKISLETNQKPKGGH